MTESPFEPATSTVQKAQIEEWLRQADKHIRAGRYLVADEELQKVFAIEPENEVALSYHDRIQFFIKQLSQRVGMNVTLAEQIRAYNARVAERKKNQLSSYLVKGQRALEDGFLKRASDYVKRALALDPKNSYATALRDRVAELEKSGGKNRSENEAHFKFRSVLLETWRSGSPSPEQLNVLSNLQTQLAITEGTRLALEREARNALYKESLQEIWNTGGISAFSTEAIEQLRQRYRISVVDHSLIEGEMLREVRKRKIKGTVLVVDEDEPTLLGIASGLRAHSFAIAAANSVEEAMTTVKRVFPDVVLSEVMFRGAPSGYDLFQFIRKLADGRAIPFLFMTPTPDRTTSIISKRLGVDDIITKPIDFEMLVASITGKLLRAQGIPRAGRIQG